MKVQFEQLATGLDDVAGLDLCDLMMGRGETAKPAKVEPEGTNEELEMGRALRLLRGEIVL